MRRTGWPAALVALLALAALGLPQASAGSETAPEVTDGSGDVAAFGAPVPQGLEWSDVRAAWFTRVADDVTLSIRVGDGAQAPPAGEVGVTFRAGAQHYIAGYTAVPPLYSGGFLSRSDAAGDVPSDADPAAMPATFDDGLLVVSFKAQDLDDSANVTSFAEPWGWSESRATNGETWRLDRTDVGTDFVWLSSVSLQPVPEDTRATSLPVLVVLATLCLVVAAARRP